MSEDDRIPAALKFVEEFYQIKLRFPTKMNKLQIAQVLLLLLCAGIQLENDDVIQSGVTVDESVAPALVDIVRSILLPGGGTCVPDDLSVVLTEPVASTPHPECAMSRSMVAEWDASFSGVVSPLRELIDSPQLARKIMRRERTLRLDLEIQLKKMHAALLQAQQDCLHYQVDAEHKAIDLGQKQQHIHELEGELQIVKSQHEEDVDREWDRQVELEAEVEGLRTVTAQQTCANASLQKERDNLQEQAEALAQQLQQQQQHYEQQIADIEVNIEYLTEDRNELHRENARLRAIPFEQGENYDPEFGTKDNLIEDLRGSIAVALANGRRMENKIDELKDTLEERDAEIAALRAVLENRPPGLVEPAEGSPRPLKRQNEEDMDQPDAKRPRLESPPRQSPPQQSPPRQSPPQQSPPRQSPPQQSPPRQSPPQQSPPRQSPPRQSPPRQSPPRQSPPPAASPLAPATPPAGPPPAAVPAAPPVAAAGLPAVIVPLRRSGRVRRPPDWYVSINFLANRRPRPRRQRR